MSKTELAANEPGKKRFARLSNAIRRIPPLTPGWKGASIALAIVACLVIFVQGYQLIGMRGVGDYLTGTVLFLLAIVLITGIVAGVLHWAKKLPSRFVWLLLASFCLLFISFIGPVQLMVIVSLSVIVAFSLLGGIVYRWMSGSYREAKRISKVTAGVVAAVMLGFIGIGGCWLLGSGNPELAKPYRLQAMKSADRYQTAMMNPAQEGTHKVKTLTYGSANSYRQEFNTEGSLITKPVDGSAFVKNWSQIRTNTFGFGPDAMALNGLVWYPDGEGPFPMVVIVHGNHLATDYSDPGYEYLGKLLASRGYIVVSIDENFLNTSPYDDVFMLNVLENENPARGWLMLEHLKVWNEWNKTKGNPFYGKADMNRIALIGHSRGGEAITVAAAYNKLQVYPEDGNIKFNYNFGIRSVISIAGTDGQYKPAGRPTVLKDLNYLAIQGAHDMDVSSFSGASQYSRVGFTSGSDDFKASVYIYGANHGQFNTAWGRYDGAGLGNRLYNMAQLMPQEEQLQAAKVLISSFLDATLNGKSEYRTVFQDLGYARKWLPDTMYIGNYLDARTTVISSFDEDIDLGTTTLAGGRLIGEHLKEWKEEKVEMKFAPEEYSAVRLGWERKAASGVPAYTVVLPEGGISARENDLIVFAMADRDDKKEALVDLTVQAVDKSGNIAALPLSGTGQLLPMFEGGIVKWPFTWALPAKEPVFQNFSFRLADFEKANPKFQPEQLGGISFVFDKTEKGTVLIRDIGIRSEAAATSS
ncbi:chlorophyllase/cutinase-like alpha/beta fold protein [Aneurinibacillus migulanus]|uniref:poly(ethylene terephthalate) hydrolase family protein n=1 Tax=Aneurinibacillus migulanus TaxID=47500 RepID=UPI00209E7A58|nr:MFS transporter [Aneurinibacillus migulanus]MCP1359276.1 MFS transporter [Aneurinibacillus migulanus]